MEETVERQQPIRVFGLFRTGVSARDSAVLGAILRNGWRKDFDGKGVPEGRLSNFIGKNLDDEVWKRNLERLIDWNLVELVAGYHGDVRRIKVTPEGQYWAIELCGDRQLAGKPVDGE